ncbi:hypothetical protein BDD12DRAFT_914954 [Trichophaea hybrida]|nr:hypothetical protein BDD12DRAFT_914954 [Trichophaea hybrida]
MTIEPTPTAATNGTTTNDTTTNGTTINGTTTTLSPNILPLPPTLSAVCARIHKKVSDFLSTPPKSELVERVQKQTRISLDVVSRALATYSFDELAISYNGGKDCLVLLLLFLSALHTHTRQLTPSQKIHSVYVMSTYPFAEVDSFVNSCIEEYSLDLHRYALPMKSAFATYLRENPVVKAVFVGTRRTDPHGEFLSHFDKTDHGWPSFMRVQPVIDWHYQEVWSFLRELEVPYCSLYDMGYTSLGGRKDTHPNPMLLVKGSSAEGGKAWFRPAYELVEDEQERLGRDR